jgi:hypothetical protein
MLTAPSNTLILLMQQVLEKRCHTADLLPARLELSSGWWLHDGNSVSGVDAPTLLVHRAAVRPAQGNQVGHIGRAAVAPVHQVVPVNHKCVLRGERSSEITLA